jgi:hypothetical protein
VVSGPIERPLARAASHLAAARYAEAAGAFRAVLCIDPHAHEAYLGLADCAVGRGQVDEAIEDLVGAAKDFAERGSLPAAFALMTKALAIDPRRLELHIDVAELEAAAGRVDLAAHRLENLSRTYEVAGRYDEATAVLEAAEAFAAMDGAPDEPAIEEHAIALEMEEEDAVPVIVVETHTEPQRVDPPARTGDTFVGPAPGPQPRAEEAVARTAARRRGSGPALRWRPSTVQMQALTADIPKPNIMAKPLPGVPKAMRDSRTAAIVHRASTPRDAARKSAGAPQKLASPDATIPISTMLAHGKRIEPVKPVAVALAKIETKPVAETKRKLEIKPLPGRAKPRPVAPIATKPSVAKPIAAAKPVPTPKPPPKQLEPKPRVAAPRPAPKRPEPRKDGDSLADRLRRHSTGSRQHLAAKVRRIAETEKRRPKTDGFEEEDATTLWCPDQLRLSDADRAP